MEITVSDEPSEIYAVGDAWASPGLLKKVDYQHYGTRHRSMMRYCTRESRERGICHFAGWRRSRDDKSR